MPDLKAIELQAVCKINVYLRVMCARPDGYHDIETIFLPLLGPCDILRISQLPQGSTDIPRVVCSGDIAISGEANICYRAAKEFAKFAEIEPLFSIDIDKRIPLSAGLGGGSSDAAAVLKALDSLYPLGSQGHLRSIASVLGADVPYFLDPSPSVGLGRGDETEKLEAVPELKILLVNPRFPVSSAWAYKKWKACAGTGGSLSLGEAVGRLRKGYRDVGVLLRNDLQEAVFRQTPLLPMITDSLRAEGALVAGMSGSGPTLFGVFSGADSLASAGCAIRSIYGKSVIVFDTSSISSAC
ncbi:MAG: hypothetical protein JW808_03335 [Victivallales bacterium]|nr:hypothetical protein [Victivallales bacterium]